MNNTEILLIVVTCLLVVESILAFANHYAFYNTQKTYDRNIKTANESIDIWKKRCEDLEKQLKIIADLKRKHLSSSGIKITATGMEWFDLKEENKNDSTTTI